MSKLDKQLWGSACKSDIRKSFQVKSLIGNADEIAVVGYVRETAFYRNYSG
jgi:hypothetical protein